MGQASAFQVSLLRSHSGPRGALTSCQDLYFPRVSSQGSLVCPPECHASCRGKRRVVHPHCSPTIKETLDLPLCLLPLPSRFHYIGPKGPQEGCFLDSFLSQGRLGQSGKRRKAVGDYEIPVTATCHPTLKP